jgi:hypothetical protein
MIEQDLKQFYKLYGANQKIMSCLKEAFEFENSFREGLCFGENMAMIAKHDNAIWEINFINKNSKLEIQQIDKKLIQARSFNNGVLELDELVDLSSTRDLTQLKTGLMKKSFLKDIISIENNNRSFAELIGFAILEYRKLFNQHTNSYSFLWEGTGFTNAFELYTYLKTSSQR